MKKIMIVAAMMLSLTSCKKKDEAPKETPAIQVSLQDLANDLMTKPGDWSINLPENVDTVLTCANGGRFQAKYIFNASPSLVLIKGEDDKTYACAINGTALNYQEISVKIPAKLPRFYPGELPKPDSCLNNTRVLDKSGHTAGWLSKITC